MASRTRLAKSTQDRFRNRIEIDVFPVLWDVRLSDVERLDVLAATLPIAARGSVFTAKRVVGQLGHVFGYGMALGCEPDGRTLKVKEPDAQIIRTFYELFKEHGTVREVKGQADKLGLKTAIRTLSSGRLKGGTPFSFGHIYYVLTNPVFAGLIRHKTNVYSGQHPSLIEPEFWDALQDQLMGRSVTNRSSKERGKRRGSRKQVPLLISKLFDETGDRLTPSYTKPSKGHRLLYHVSNRFI